MIAQMSGRCGVCNSKIKQGDIVYWDQYEQGMHCTRCSGSLMSPVSSSSQKPSTFRRKVRRS